jgi:hypothetical protein
MKTSEREKNLFTYLQIWLRSYETRIFWSHVRVTKLNILLIMKILMETKKSMK